MNTTNPALLKLLVILRWGSSIPLAIVFAALAGVVIKFMWLWSVGRYVDPETASVISMGFNIVAESSVAAGSGAAFMLASTKIAPSEKISVVYVMAGFGTILCLAFLALCLFGFPETKWLEAWTSICMALGVIGFVYEKHSMTRD
ncbi:MAG: hypothetical protein AB7S81_04685 [Bdellovibrionales bacterium]